MIPLFSFGGFCTSNLLFSRPNTNRRFENTVVLLVEIPTSAPKPGIGSCRGKDSHGMMAGIYFADANELMVDVFCRGFHV